MNCIHSTNRLRITLEWRIRDRRRSQNHLAHATTGDEIDIGNKTMARQAQALNVEACAPHVQQWHRLKWPPARSGSAGQNKLHVSMINSNATADVQ